MGDWKTAHGKVISDFLEELNKSTDKYILKGGTALMTCYGLDRFSEDVDLDGRGEEIIDIVDKFCSSHNYNYRVAKNTDTVKRCMIHYNDNNKPLKIEVSARRGIIPESEVTRINGIRVYNINSLAMMKSNAYMGRDKIRDLYDVTFICNNYFDKLSDETKFVMQNAISSKGIEQFDYIVNSQSDDLINPDKLAGEFLNAYDRLGLLMEDEEVREVKEICREAEDDYFEELKKSFHEDKTHEGEYEY